MTEVPFNWVTFRRIHKSELWIKGKPSVSRWGTNLHLRRQLSDFIRRARLLSPLLRPTSLSAKLNATGFLWHNTKNVPTVGLRSGWNKILYLSLSCLSHLACFQRGPGQAGACFRCLIDTWARGLTQIPSAPALIKQQDALCHFQKQTAELDGAAGERWASHTNFFWQEATV